MMLKFQCFIQNILKHDYFQQVLDKVLWNFSFNNFNQQFPFHQIFYKINLKLVILKTFFTFQNF